MEKTGIGQLGRLKTNGHGQNHIRRNTAAIQMPMAKNRDDTFMLDAIRIRMKKMMQPGKNRQQQNKNPQPNQAARHSLPDCPTPILVIASYIQHRELRISMRKIK